MRYLRKSSKPMALSLAIALAITALFAVAMDVKTIKAATTSGQATLNDKSNEVPLDSWWNPCSWRGVKKICETTAKVVKTVICLYNTPPYNWPQCFGE